MGWGGGDRILTMGRRLGGGNGEGKMGRGATGRGRWEGGKGEGKKKGQEEEAFYRWIRFNVIGYRIELKANSMLGATEVQAHVMPGWNEVTEFSDFVCRATPGTPASLY